MFLTGWRMFIAHSEATVLLNPLTPFFHYEPYVHFVIFQDFRLLFFEKVQGFAKSPRYFNLFRFVTYVMTKMSKNDTIYLPKSTWDSKHTPNGGVPKFDMQNTSEGV